MSWLDGALALSPVGELGTGRARGHGPQGRWAWGRRPWARRVAVGAGGPGRVAPSVWPAMAMVGARTCIVDSEEDMG